MGAFGAESAKPTILYSNDKALIDPFGKRSCPTHGKFKEMVKKYTDSLGRKRVCGNGNLKTSEPETEVFLFSITFPDLPCKHSDATLFDHYVTQALSPRLW